jgi:hypothetical protein
LVDETFGFRERNAASVEHRQQIAE